MFWDLDETWQNLIAYLCPPDLSLETFKGTNQSRGSHFKSKWQESNSVEYQINFSPIPKGKHIVVIVVKYTIFKY